jgi:hypothetical protein
MFNYCGGKKDKVEEQFDFAISDESQLGLETFDKDLGVKFNSPKKWKFQSASLSRKIEETKNSTNINESFSYQPVYLFFDDSTGSVLSVGFVDNGDTTVSYDFKRNQYKNILHDKYSKDSATVNEFSYLKINYTLLKFERNSLISYKILFTSNKGLIMFDFTIRNEYHDSELRKVKACIGSILSI